ncbi:MAG: cation:proton antiporter [Thermoplasmata archaeon]|nr:cation:proton antiporter [Thermoplasmata archaeon]
MFEEILGDIFGDQWFQITMILAVAILSSFLFVRMHLPKIIGQIVLGIIIGPSILGIISLPEEGTVGIVTLLAGFGAIIMLFMIGLEFEIRDIYTKKNIAIAIGGVSLPWIAGFFLAEFLLPDPGVGFTKFSQSIFVGTALVATSVAITAGVLREMKLINTSVAKTILGAAVVDDVIGMVVLAITAGVALGEGVDAIYLTQISIFAVIFVSAGAYIGMKFVTKVIGSVERIGIKYGLRESGFLLALSFAFLYAFIADRIGISAIVGAFIAGTSFAGCEYREQFKEGIAFLEWVFAPIFFISLGILVNILLPLEIWMFALILGAVAILSKIVGGGLPAWLFKMKPRESISIGLGMSPRLEVAMIIALFGLQFNIINSSIYSVIIIMGLITVLVTPPLLRQTMKKIRKEQLDEGVVCKT